MSTRQQLRVTGRDGAILISFFSLSKKVEELDSEPFDGEQRGWVNVLDLEVSCWRLVNARRGLRGVRVGEVSHPGPPLLRRLRSGRSRGVPIGISSDEESAAFTDTWSRRIAEVESVADVTLFDASQFSQETVPATRAAR